MSNSQFNPINPPESGENKTARKIQQSKQYQKLDTEQKAKGSEEKNRVNEQDKLQAQKEEEQQKAQAEKEKEESRENLERVKELTNSLMSQLNIALDYEEDKDLNEMIVKVMNKETNELIRQIPAEEMLQIAKRMEEMTGMLINKWS